MVLDYHPKDRSMKTLTLNLFLLLVVGILISSDARSQERRLLALSPRVGTVIDSTERRYYDLFYNIKDFHSASIYQCPGDTFRVVAKRKAGGVFMRDTVFMIPQSLIDLYADRIEHREELLRGTYVPDVRPHMVTYEDGTPLQFPSIGRKAEVKAPRLVRNDNDAIFPDDRLPLAQNSSGLYRPMFHTTHFAFSLGGLVTDFSSLSSLNANASDFCMPLTFYLEVPIAEVPLISVIGGWGFALGGASGGSLFTFSTALIYRTGTSSFSPIVGIGAARTSYSYYYVSSGSSHSSNTNLAIDAASSYGMLIAGICLVPNRIDLLCALPLGSDLHTAFEKQSYTISPAVFQVSFLVSL
jgi:hypothetical protein